MSTLFGDHAPVGPGVQGQSEPRKFINRTGGTITRGYVATIDFGLTSTEAVGHDVGQEDAGSANAVAPVAGDISGDPRLFAILDQESLADNKEGRWIIRGPVRAQCVGSSALTANNPLVVTTNGHLDKTTAAGETIVAIPLEVNATSLTVSPNSQLRWVLFDGEQFKGHTA